MCVYRKCDFIIIDIDFFYGRCGRYIIVTILSNYI